MARSALAFRDERQIGRDEVYYRARAFGPDAKPLTLLIVNISAMGLMARCDCAWGPGTRLSVTLPVLGVVGAEIRWALGGRLGCELDRTIELADYYELLAVMLRAK